MNESQRENTALVAQYCKKESIHTYILMDLHRKAYFSKFTVVGSLKAHRVWVIVMVWGIWALEDSFIFCCCGVSFIISEPILSQIVYVSIQIPHPS